MAFNSKKMKKVTFFIFFFQHQSSSFSSSSNPLFNSFIFLISPSPSQSPSPSHLPSQSIMSQIKRRRTSDLNSASASGPASPASASGPASPGPDFSDSVAPAAPVSVSPAPAPAPAPIPVPVPISSGGPATVPVLPANAIVLNLETMPAIQEIKTTLSQLAQANHIDNEDEANNIKRIIDAALREFCRTHGDLSNGCYSVLRK